jgi:DNA polymerase-3 subunit chi
MTRIDFYVLGERSRVDVWGTACRLAEKAWKSGHRVLLQVSDESSAAHLDRLLWTFRDQSFVPHGRLGSAAPGLNPVLIGQDESGGEEHEVLINLTPAVPGFFSRFERVAEVIAADPQTRAVGRERYRFYRDRGYPLHTYDIGE